MSDDSASRVPPISLATLWTMVLAGCVATVAFDYFGQSLSPMLGFANLAPIPLANNIVAVLTGEGSRPAAHLLHYLAGVVAYPVGWIWIVRPLGRRFVPWLHWLPLSVLYGAALWVLALYILAHLVAGNPPFLGFSGITWVALAGHILFAVVAAAVVRWRQG